MKTWFAFVFILALMKLRNQENLWGFFLLILDFMEMHVFKGNVGVCEGLPELLVKEVGRNAGIKDWKEVHGHATEQVRI